MIKIGIIGGTGYTGVELLRLLAGHPQASVQAAAATCVHLSVPFVTDNWGLYT